MVCGRRTVLLVLITALAAVLAPVATGAPPAGPTGIALDALVELAWQPAPGATAYDVYRGTTPGSITTRITPVGGTVGLGFADTGAVNGTTYYYAVRAIVAGAESSDSASVEATPAAPSCTTGNTVVRENCFPGNPGWNVTDAVAFANGGIEAFATEASIDNGGSVDLKVRTGALTTYTVEIYRSGWYGGAGARLFSRVRGLTAGTQPACQSDAQTGLYDCSTWAVSGTLTTTPSWPSGVYLVRFIRDDNGADWQTVLAVRDDSRNADVLYGIADTTYQAYNNYGGKSLYTSYSTGAATVSGTTRAVKISYDRPYIQPSATTRFDWYPRADFPLVSWLERSGYDVAYQSDVDLERNPARVRDHRVYVLPAHDEYYSAGMRSALEQARDAGVSLFSSGSNQVFWRIRFEASPVSGRAHRVEVGYKTSEGGAEDPVLQTRRFRDPAGPNQPENALLGSMYIGDNAAPGGSSPLVVSAVEGTDRIWRYTGLDAQAPGSSTSIGTAIVGWEWDARFDNGAEPAGVKTLASSPVSGNLLLPSGVYDSGSATANVTKYQAASGALVFQAGTNRWAWGLARNADGLGEPDRRIQQATTNVLADMGAQPGTPAADITLDNASAPRVASTSPTDAQVGVALAASVTAVFSRAIDPATITTSSFTLKRPDGTVVPATVSYDAATATARLLPSASLANSTTYTATLATTVTATDGAALQSPAAWVFTTLAAGTVRRINTGGAAFTTGGGLSFLADTNFSGGSTYTTSAAIAGTTDDALYQNERWGAWSYAIPVTNAIYDVRLHFVEAYYVGGAQPGGAGKRVFSVDIGDTPGSADLRDLDIFAEVGANAALVKTIQGVTVSDGALDVQAIYGAADDPQIAAIEVYPTTLVPGTPTVASTSPANGATAVSTSTTVRATFSTPMDASTITSSSFTLELAATAVPATVSYDGATQTATLTPSAALAGAATYTARLATSIKASGGTPLAAPASWSFSTAAPPQVGAIRINAGGGAFTSASGQAFTADASFSGGGILTSGAPIAGTSDDALYQNERWGGWTYAIPIANGSYDVHLHFVELYFGTTVPGGVGSRVFSVDVADTAASPDLRDLDIFAEVGKNAALVKTVRVTVSDGTLNIRAIYGAADDPELAAIEVVPSGAPPPPPPASVTGVWSDPAPWPLVAVHMSLLPTGDVLAFDGFDAAVSSERIWKPSADTFTPVPYGRNLFCSAHLLLADGRTLIAGGHENTNVGLADTTLFDATTNTWTRAPDMAVARWYPSATQLADGRVLVFSGDNIVPDREGVPPPFSDASVDSLPEIYDPKANSWTALDGARLTSPLYPFLFLLTDGRVFNAGPDTTTRILDPASWTWSIVGESPFDGMSAVHYRPDRIMKAGSWADPDFAGPQLYPAHGRTAVIDLGAPSPSWRETAPMNYPRAYHTLTLLPDGTTLASGGGSVSDGVDLTKAVPPAEIWDPDTETWTTVASLKNGRLYHSTAILLADGRVLMAGGGALPGSTAVDQRNAEIFSPPYLFRGPRPTIASAPSTAGYGAPFTVTTPDADRIASISLIRSPSVTHALDMNQRFMRLSFTKGSGTLTVSAPADARLAPPGYYLLFLVDTNGVPSVASFLRFPAPWEDDVAPTAPGTLAATPAGAEVALSWTAATDNVGVAGYDVYRSTSSGFTPSSANRIAQVGGTTYVDPDRPAGTFYYRVKARDGVGNLSGSSNEAAAVVAPAPPSGLVAAYSFDAGSGTSAADASGRSNTGTLSGATWTASGRNGGALSFDGVNDLVTVADSASLDLTTGMTLEAWVRPSALGASWRTVLIKEQPGNLVYALYANAENNRPSGHVFAGADLYTLGTATLAANTWTHLAATYDGAALRLYVNGVQASTRNLSGAMPNSAGALRIGGNNVWTEWFSGLIDDVRIYNRALSPTEVLSDMNRAVG